MTTVIDLARRGTGAGHAAAVAVFIVALFVAAWLLSSITARIAARLVDRAESRRGSDEDTRAIAAVRQRETAIALITTTLRYVLFAIAVVLAFVALSGAHTLQTIVGASFLALMLGFAVQRFLMDVVAGLLMFFDGWFRIGDAVAVDVWNAQGVVEAVSLRSLTLRTVQGEVIYIPNSQVLSLRRIPRGYREVEVELFATDGEQAEELVEEIARIVPVGPTQFLRRPATVETERLADDLHRVTARCAVAVGREWLADDLLPTLIRERAREGLVVHGPIVTFVDEQAVRSFARASRSRAVARAPKRR
jgi:small conductance mechanosensitive channel